MASRHTDSKPYATAHGVGSTALRLEVHADAEAAAQRAAAWIAELARQAMAQRNRFVLALSGGRTPGPMLRYLADAAIDWRKVELAQVDERVAAMGSAERNLSQLQDILLARVALPARQVHAMPVDEADLATAAAAYAQRLSRLAGSPPRLDLVQLGLGADGHTASLVSGDPALAIRDADVAITAPYNGWRRMTLTLPIINRARHILWLVTGEDKAAMVARLVQGDPLLPASGVDRESALLIVDHAAGARLPPTRA